MIMLADKGHAELILELTKLLDEAKRGLYHDFALGLDDPKVALYNRLIALSRRMMNGDFDN